MSEDRKPKPRCPIQARLQALEAAKLRHYNLTRIARLEREVAALPDPESPSAYEMSSRASDARIQGILRDLAGIRAACEPEGR
ncbi:hypothetical protein ASD38_08930 [Caulobacter sp. Root487D2Y]|uniref:hypothetical protein n=1 Tax=Caulobacter sp. Root487D2Y TaxID=1736547 RepID=UPI0006FD5EA0|nr:hypothetical protein [Caulobacter sp. Root487D2Y]KQY29462.1 hypothetical protein ASD38_08930 [Caulobacter sp. Root487D2Y]